MTSPSDVQSVRVRFAAPELRLSAAGISSFRPPPAEPATCCGRGCNGCVWEGFYAAAAWWCEEVLEVLAEEHAQSTPPAGAPAQPKPGPQR